MYEWAQRLWNLQEVDIAAAKWNEELAKIPVKKTEAQTIYQAEYQACEEAKAASQAVELEIRNLEREIGTVREQKNNFQSKTALIKNNDEYKSALIQIEMCDHTISDLETRQLELMDASEEAHRLLEEKKKALEAGQKRAQAVCSQLDEEAKALQEKLAVLGQKRSELAALVDPQQLALYDRLRTARRNVQTRPCFVPIENGFCGRCHVKVTSQMATIAKKGQLLQCGACAAMLFSQETPGIME